MSTFPYAGIPRQQVWKRAVPDRNAAIIDMLRADDFTYCVTQAGRNKATSPPSASDLRSDLRNEDYIATFAARNQIV